MRFNELHYEMTATKAFAIFSRFGVNVTGMPPEQLKIARNRLLKANHPDHGGTSEDTRSITDAYNFLKSHGTSAPPEKTIGLSNQSYQVYRGDSCASGRMPGWAVAGYSGGSLPNTVIYVNNFTDTNFFKKAMWELSGKSTIAYTIWGFDGHSFRNSITVFGSPSIFNTMADAMVIWQTKSENPCPTRAVLVSPFQGQGLYLIYADGSYYGDEPLAMKHQSINVNPGNDQEFIRKLPEILEQLKAHNSSG